MSDEEKPRRGPVMLVATDSLKAPEVRIGKIGENITLPRTVRAASLVAALAGGFVGMVAATVFLGMSVQTIAYGLILGALVGVGLVSYSPLRGESLGRWALLKFKARKNRTDRNGRPVRLAVGICYIDPTVEGMVRLVPGAADIRPGSVDDRFVPVEHKKHQLNAQQRLGLRALPEDLDDQPAKQTPDDTSPLANFRGAAVQGPSADALALEQYRTATLTDASLGGFEHSEEFPKNNNKQIRRRHGRWVQDGSELSALYSQGRQEVPGDELDENNQP